MQSALSNLEGALAAYGRSLEIDPAVPAGRIKLGRAYFSNNRVQEALVELERATQEAPDNSDAYLSLSEVRLAGAQWEEAVAAAERAIKLGATDPRALYLLGTALVRLGRREQGQERLQEFARVEAGFQDAKSREREIASINTAAIAALRDGDGNAAIKHLSEGIMRFPDAARLHMNLALVESRMGRHEKAVEILESMLEHGRGRSFLIHRNLAEEYEMVGNPAASHRHRDIYLETRESELILK
jgi:tetratricopeptide (TPR) repeat protein